RAKQREQAGGEGDLGADEHPEPGRDRERREPAGGDVAPPARERDEQPPGREGRAGDRERREAAERRAPAERRRELVGEALRDQARVAEALDLALGEMVGGL